MEVYNVLLFKNGIYVSTSWFNKMTNIHQVKNKQGQVMDEGQRQQFGTCTWGSTRGLNNAGNNWYNWY